MSIVLVGCDSVTSDRAQDGGAATPTDGLTIVVVETNYELSVEPRDGLVPARYTFVVQNEGNDTHRLAIRGRGVDEQTPLIPPGEAEEISLSLRPGEYEFWCPVSGHRDRGMLTSLLVEAL
ncbi:MAG: cupredoxin domain-containing protein [Acidimicrobiales bacterium]